VRPDIVCLAKGIANGFPLGATAARQDIMREWGITSHGTTYGGSPISCVAALATMSVIREEGLLENAREQGSYALEELRALQSESPIVGDVRGIGLMLAVEFVVPDGGRKPNPAVVQRVLRYALQEGLLLYPCGHWTQTVRIIPPLSISRTQIKEGLDIFRQAVLAASG
jgi:4-aminobutyrate aminotransferase